MTTSLGLINLVLLAPPALALLVAMRVLFGRTMRTPPEPMQVLLSVSSSILLVLAGLGALLGMFWIWVVNIPLLLACVVLGLMVFDRTRQSEHRGLVWALAAAATRGIPLAQAARAYADETPGPTGRRAI